MKNRTVPRYDIDPNVEPANFFRTEKRKGRWWLIDPYGHERLSIGVNSVRIASKHGVQGDLGSMLEKSAAVSDVSLASWTDSVSRLWKTAGFNALGAWSDMDLLRDMLASRRSYHYTINLNLLGGYRKTTGTAGRLLPVFDENFTRYSRQRMRELAHRSVDPTLLGYFTDNEIPFWTVRLDDYLAISDETNANRQAALSWLSRHQIDPDRLSDSDHSNFRLYVLQTYLEAVSTAIASVDSNHLNLGPRLYGPELNDEAFLRRLGNHVDVVSINFYQKLQPSEQQMWQWEAWSGKPFLISEFSIKSADTGKANTGGAGWEVATQTDRGRFYENFTLALLSSRNCVGFHWYRYSDTAGDNKGLVDDSLVPYADLLESIAAINRQVYFLTDYFDNRLWR